MIKTDNVMNDVEATVRILLDGRVIRLEDIIAKIRVLVVPALDERERVIDTRDMEIREYMGERDDLQEEVNELRQEVEEHEADQVRQEIIDIFNQC